MKKLNNNIRLSAGDLSKYLGCQFLTQLDRASVENRLDKKYYPDLTLEALQQRGFEHESAYVDYLEKKGLSVFKIQDEKNHKTAYEKTVEAIEKGYDYIVQATLIDDRWLGRADILRKVSCPSQAGKNCYEIIDTKLARDTRAGTILQLCLYSLLLEKIQGTFPEKMAVVIPGNNFKPIEYRTSDFTAYFRFVKEALTQSIEQPPLDIKSCDELYPEPCDQCDICDWWDDTRQRKSKSIIF